MKTHCPVKGCNKEFEASSIEQAKYNLDTHIRTKHPTEAKKYIKS